MEECCSGKPDLLQHLKTEVLIQPDVLLVLGVQVTVHPVLVHPEKDRVDQLPPYPLPWKRGSTPMKKR